MDKQTKYNLLFDYYGNLLTEKQQLIMQLAFGEDMSLAEIAEQLNISRQGVYDQIKKSGKLLEDYEKKLGFWESEQNSQLELKQALAELAALRKTLTGNYSEEAEAELKKVETRLKKLIVRVEE